MTANTAYFQSGVTNIRHHVNRDIKTKKFYLRQGVELDDESMVTAMEGMVTVPPKNEIEDPFSSSSSEDDFFSDDDDFFSDD